MAPTSTPLGRITGDQPTEKGVHAASLCKCLMDLDSGSRHNVYLEIDYMMRVYLEGTYSTRLEEAANMPEGRVHTPTVHPDTEE